MALARFRVDACFDTPNEHKLPPNLSLGRSILPIRSFFEDAKTLY